MGRPVLRLWPVRDAAGARRARCGPPGAARRGVTGPQAWRWPAGSDRLPGRAPEGISAGFHGAEHGLRRGRLPRLRGDGCQRHAAAGLPRGAGVRVQRDRVGGRVVNALGLWRVAILERLAPLAGMAGALAIGACSLLAVVGYRGSAGETYSPLNHYVSDLGEAGVSRLAPIFNIGLIAGGLCFAVFIVGFGAARGGLAGLAISAVGAIAGIAGALVGVFPVNDIDRHTLATY